MTGEVSAGLTGNNAIAFFDGQNLYRHAKEAFGHHHPNYDPVALHKAVCDQFGLRRTLTRFYTGVPDKVHGGWWADYWNNRVLALKRAGVVVTTRPIRYRDKTVYDANGNEIVSTVPQEKGIDVRIALDMVLLAVKKQYEVAILFSQDQDLNEVVTDLFEISKVQQRPIKVICAFPDSPDASSRRGVEKTEWFKMDRSFYDACLDPRDYRPKIT